MLFCPCDVWKATERFDKKALNLCHQPKKGFGGIFIGIPQNHKGYLVNVPGTSKKKSSYDVVLYQLYYIMLAYTSQPYAEEMDLSPAVSYTPDAASPKEQIVDIITFTQF